MAITIKMNQNIQSLQIIDNICVCVCERERERERERCVTIKRINRC